MTSILSQEDLQDTLENVIESEAGNDHTFLEAGDACTLLEGESNCGKRCGIIGYPAKPFSKSLASIFSMWLKTRSCPLDEQPMFQLLNDSKHVAARKAVMVSVGKSLIGLESLWTLLKEDEKMFRVRAILKELGRRGMLDLLGVRKTEGSITAWPPSRSQLMAAFQSLHKEGSSKLTVGARAHAKHAHRDETSSWWGKSTGPEDEKNAIAQEIVGRILDGAVWINLHELPGQTPVLEIRREEGYGARWSADGEQFRGFLEPQMEEGWAVGWRH